MTTWTGTPATFTAGQTSGVSTGLNGLRDTLKALSEARTSFGSGAANWGAATTPPSLGNGTWAGRYLQVNKFISFGVRVTMGSSTTYGTGAWKILLPVAPHAADPCHFEVVCYDSSAGAFYRGVAVQPASGSVTLAADNGGAGGLLAGLTGTVPFTWATGDVLEVTGIYEGA